MRRFTAVIAVLIILSALAAVPASAGGVAPCPGSLPTQLLLGGRGQIAGSFSTLRDAPGGIPIQIVNAPAEFTVIGGHESDGFLCYFQLQYDSGATGWAVESQVTSAWGDNIYWLTPTTPPPPIVNPLCPGGLPNLLTFGGRGYVVSAYSTLRDSPGGAPIQRVYAPAEFTVIGGPVSDGFLCYYEIQYDNGASGWAAESQIVSAWGSNKYWLAPLSAG